MVANITITDLPFHEEPPRGQPLPTGPGFTKLWPIVQALWAAGERDWLAPFLVKSVIEAGHLDALLRQPFGSRCLVAADGEQLVGFAWLVGQRVVALWVLPAMRRRGVCRQLVEAAKEAAQRAGYPFVEIEYPAGNKAAVAFCRALGFRPASRRAVEIEGQRVGSGVVFVLLTRQYNHARRLRLVTWAGAVFVIWLSVRIATGGQPPPIALLCGTFALFQVATLLWCERAIWTDAGGIATGWRFGPRRRLAWDELRAIRTSAFDQALTLRGDGQRGIGIESTYRNVKWLVETVHRMRPELWRQTGGPEFRVGGDVLFFWIPFAVMPWAILLCGLSSGEAITGWQGGLLLALFGTMGVYTLSVTLKRPYRIRIEGDTLRLRYLLREEVIPAAAISRVNAQLVFSPELGGTEVALNLRGKRNIYLSGFTGHTNELGNTLVAWHRQARQTLETGG